jgi:hypothetical protein
MELSEKQPVVWTTMIVPAFSCAVNSAYKPSGEVFKIAPSIGSPLQNELIRLQTIGIFVMRRWFDLLSMSVSLI